jgi:hypothetical protein
MDDKQPEYRIKHFSEDFERVGTGDRVVGWLTGRGGGCRHQGES